MTMNESQFTAKIKGYLDDSSAGLKAGTAYRLQQARAEALARLAEPQHAAELTFAGAAYQQGQSAQQIRELEETDAAILSSHLPIDAYRDRGFNNWLRHGDE